MSEFINKTAIITCSIMIVLLNIVHVSINEFQINYIFLLIFLAMFLSPIINLLRINKKIIFNPMYNLLLIFANIYIIYISFNCLKLGINSYAKVINQNIHDVNYINTAKNYLNKNILYMLIAIILILLISMLFKKKNEEEMISSNGLKYVLITSIANEIFFKFLSYNLHIIPESANIIILLWFIFKNKLDDYINETNYYLILFILCVFSLNPTSIVITFYIYIQYKKRMLGYSDDLD